MQMLSTRAQLAQRWPVQSFPRAVGASPTASRPLNHEGFRQRTLLPTMAMTAPQSAVVKPRISQSAEAQPFLVCTAASPSSVNRTCTVPLPHRLPVDLIGAPSPVWSGRWELLPLQLTFVDATSWKPGTMCETRTWPHDHLSTFITTTMLQLYYFPVDFARTG